MTATTTPTTATERTRRAAAVLVARADHDRLFYGVYTLVRNQGIAQRLRRDRASPRQPDDPLRGVPQLVPRGGDPKSVSSTGSGSSSSGTSSTAAPTSSSRSSRSCGCFANAQAPLPDLAQHPGGDRRSRAARLHLLSADATAVAARELRLCRHAADQSAACGPSTRGTMSKISNQYAAMPSLHFAWSTWCAFVLVPMIKHDVGQGAHGELSGA